MHAVLELLTTISPTESSGSKLIIDNTLKLHLLSMALLGEQSSSETLCTCSSEVGIAVGALLLVEGIIAGVITIIVVSCWIVMRY